MAGRGCVLEQYLGIFPGIRCCEVENISMMGGESLWAKFCPKVK